MATVQSPLQSAAAKGSVGQVTYSVHKSSNVARKRSYPGQPRTARQLSIRALLTTYSRDWSTIASSDRDSWNEYAVAHPLPDKFGNLRAVSGFDWYIACNVLLVDAGFLPVDMAPAILGPGAVASLVATAGAAQVSFAFTPAAGTSITLDIWGYGPHSQGLYPNLARATHRTYSPGQTSPKVLAGLAVGLWTFWVRFIDETTGLVSPFVKTTASPT